MVAPGNHFKALVGTVMERQCSRTDFLSTRDHGRLTGCNQKADSLFLLFINYQGCRTPLITQHTCA